MSGMSYMEVLIHPTIMLATFFYIIMSIGFEISYQLFLNKISHVSGSYWIAKNMGTPFFHVLLLIAFIYMSYPTLFGIEAYNSEGERIIPSLSQLLSAKRGQTMKMINTLFIISVILPIIPMFKRLLALILPLQAIAASAILYGWLNQIMESEYSIFPSYTSLALIIIISIIAGQLAKVIGMIIGGSWNTNFHTHDMEKVIYKSCLLIFQIPILLIYTLSLS